MKTLGTYRRPKLGDLIEIRTPKGLAYMQYTYKDALYGYLLRILPGLHLVRPQAMDALAHQEELYYVFFPLGAALVRRLVAVACHALVPPGKERPPLTRRRGGITREGRVLNWFIGDWTKEWCVETLTPAQRRLSILSIWNDTLLIERLTEGWTPEGEAKFYGH